MVFFALWQFQFAVFCYKKKTLMKTTWIEKGLFHLTGYSLSSREGKARTKGGNLEAGIESESTQEYNLIAYFQALFQYFPYVIRLTCLGMVLPTDHSNGSSSSTDALPYQMYQVDNKSKLLYSITVTFHTTTSFKPQPSLSCQLLRHHVNIIIYKTI